MDEISLIQEIAKGDEEALKKLIRLYKNRVFLYTYGILRDYEDSEEATAEVFFQVWRSAKKFKGRSRVSTWIFGIARNVCMNLLRKRKRRFQTLEIMERDAVYEEVDLDENIEILRQAIDQLPPAHREVIHLAFYEELPYSEIAQILKVPENTVKTRVFYAKKKLREIVKRLKGEDKEGS